MLTTKQTDVLGLLAGGLRRKQIAYVLSISEQTVKRRMVSCRMKLNARTIPEAVAIAMREGIIQ